MNMYSISQIATLVGLPPKTIRFYEEEGIISSAERAENGYRQYSAEAVEELKLIKHARDLGLPISEIKKLMQGCDEGNCHHTKQHIDSTIDNYVALLNEKIAQFSHLQTQLKQLKKNLVVDQDTCKQDGYCCNILHQLAAISNPQKGEPHAR